MVDHEQWKLFALDETEPLTVGALREKLAALPSDGRVAWFDGEYWNYDTPVLNLYDGRHVIVHRGETIDEETEL